MNLFNPEDFIKLILKPGAVFYYVNEKLTSKEPHYHIVLNHTPQTDSLILLAVSSSSVEKVKNIARLKKYPPETIIEITNKEYSDFTKNVSIVDCNNIFISSSDDLIKIYKNTGINAKYEMSENIVQKLRNGVLSGPFVEPSIKNILRQTEL